MRKLILLLTLTAVLLQAVAQGARAQEDNLPEFKMPCRQVLRLTPERFADVYGKRTQDYSTAGQKQAFSYYVDCKRPANDALAARLLTEEKRRQADVVREELNKFGAALWNLTYGEAGGGTMWGLVAAGAYAERESFMEAVIGDLAKPARRRPWARQTAGAYLSKVQRMLSAPARKPFIEGMEPGDSAERLKIYQETLQEARESLAKLRVIVNGLPDAAALRVAEKMAREARNALEMQQ